MNKYSKLVKFLLVLFTAFIIFAVIFFSKNNASSNTNFGVILPLTGDASSIGESLKQGIDLAFKQENMPSPKYEDSKGVGAKEALTASKKLINIDHVKSIIGPLGPIATLAIMSQAESDTLNALYAISLCDPRFAEYKKIFCAFPSLEDQVADSKRLISKLDLQSVSLLTETGELGDIAEKTMTETAKAGNFDLLSIERVSVSSKNYKTNIVKIKEKNPHALYIIGSPEIVPTLLRQLHELDFKGKILLQADISEDDLLKLGEVSKGIYLPSFISKKYDKSFEEEFLKTYGKKPEFYSAFGQSVAILALQAETGRNLNKTAIPGIHFKSDRKISVSFASLLWDGSKMLEIK